MRRGSRVRRVLEDQLLHLLELVGAGARRAARTAPSRRSSAPRRPARPCRSPSSRFVARCASRPRRRRRAPRRPPSSRSRTVWLTQTCASMPQTSAWSRPRGRSPSASAAEKQTFSSGSTPLGQVLGDLGRGRPEALRVLLGDDDRDAERVGALRPASPSRRRSPSKPGTALRKASWTSITTSAARSRSSFARSRGHPHREAALPVGDPAGRDRHQHPAAQRRGRRSTSCPSGSPSPRAPASHSASRSSSARFASRADRDPRRLEAERLARPAPIRSTSSAEVEHARAARARCRGRRTRSRARSRPSPPASNGTSFSSSECGAWSVATQSIVPSRRPSISAWRSSSVRSGGFILKRESRLRTASSVSVRWCGVASQVIRDAGRLRRARPPRPTRAHERCWTWIARLLVGGERGVAGDHRRLRDRRDRRRARARAETSPSCITPSPESSGSSSCSAIAPPTRRWYWSARRSTPGVARSAGRRRRSRPRPPSRSSAISVSSSPAIPRVTAGDEADRHRRLARGPLAQRRRRRRRCRPAARCSPSRRSRSSRRRRRRGSRSRCPPRPRGPGVRRWTCGSKKAGNDGAGPRPRSPRRRPALGASRLGELGDLAVADDDVVACRRCPRAGRATRGAADHQRRRRLARRSRASRGERRGASLTRAPRSASGPRALAPRRQPPRAASRPASSS